ncbi:NAD(P)/FAD-dependent oxidoreductase [Ornithinicoccus halotolerans]|uniref:NAD(P)/FAD-dependent oxidoreductase n=1 Tax=Ornithinicoccus halotolerans TaxID=1748220 RepID=UPI00129575F8|nr:NAD(P)/FAD-dependent oxidoreductase [Ornithinicoccus halotolerans]
MSLPHHVDALVVGGGAAGLAAATWLGRYQRTTLVVDDDGHRNRCTARVRGYLTRDPVTPQEFLTEARGGLQQYPTVTLHDGRVTAVRAVGDDGFAATVDGTEVFTRRIVLATGVRDVVPDVEGFAEHYGQDVYHCPACDGQEARGRRVVVLGAGRHVPAFAAELLDWAEGVCIVTDRDDPPFTVAQRDTCAEHEVGIVDGRPVALVGDPGQLQGVRLQAGGIVSGSIVFFSYGHDPGNDLARELGCDLDEDGHVRVNEFQLTSVAGVYAAGDLTPGMQLVPVAAGEGTIAGIGCATSLRGHRTVSGDGAVAPPVRRFTDR